MFISTSFINLGLETRTTPHHKKTALIKYSPLLVTVPASAPYVTLDNLHLRRSSQQIFKPRICFWYSLFLLSFFSFCSCRVNDRNLSLCSFNLIFLMYYVKYVCLGNEFKFSLSKILLNSKWESRRIFPHVMWFPLYRP